MWRAELYAEDKIRITGPQQITWRQLQGLAQQLRESSYWVDIVAGRAEVVAVFNPLTTMPEGALDTLNHQLQHPVADLEDGALITIPVIYGGDDGPDLKHLAAQAGITEPEFIQLHTASPYHVEFVGFLPGFAYMGPLHPKLHQPRMSTPRPLVAAGSVAIGADQTGIYPVASPGGWSIIGRTTVPLFDQQSAHPFLLKPGMRVKFTCAS